MIVFFEFLAKAKVEANRIAAARKRVFLFFIFFTPEFLIKTLNFKFANRSHFRSSSYIFAITLSIRENTNSLT